MKAPCTSQQRDTTMRGEHKADSDYYVVVMYD
jgi:hypothetical protein